MWHMCDTRNGPWPMQMELTNLVGGSLIHEALASIHFWLDIAWATLETRPIKGHKTSILLYCKIS